VTEIAKRFARPAEGKFALRRGHAGRHGISAATAAAAAIRYERGRVLSGS
jgi:hypothetical protein